MTWRRIKPSNLHSLPGSSSGWGHSLSQRAVLVMLERQLPTCHVACLRCLYCAGKDRAFLALPLKRLGRRR